MKFYSVTAIDTRTDLRVVGGWVAENILDKFVENVKAEHPEAYVSVSKYYFTECPQGELQARLMDCYTESGKKFMVFAK